MSCNIINRRVRTCLGFPIPWREQFSGSLAATVTRLSSMGQSTCGSTTALFTFPPIDQAESWRTKTTMTTSISADRLHRSGSRRLSGKVPCLELSPIAASSLRTELLRLERHTRVSSPFPTARKSYTRNVKSLKRSGVDEYIYNVVTTFFLLFCEITQ